ncbi:MAG: WYL domain-containing transcriptional regulator [Planctomycetes bacterium]|nr:WYL domain-containing transcriptional regulator [Planctomycetota bacterium]
MKSSRISRVVQILTTLQAGKYYAVDDLSKMLGTSRRTVFRDLKELQAIGVPYHYNSKEGGYSIDPEFFLPPIDLNLQEALSLLMLTHKASRQMQLPFRNSALLAALKIENNLPLETKRRCNLLLKNISTKATAQAPTKLLDQAFATLQKAIAEKNKVVLIYHSFFEGKTIDLQIHPYHLLYNQRAWYLVAFSEMHNSIRTFKLNRIKEIQVLKKRFISGEKFDIYDYLGKCWSMIPEGKIYNIKLRFMPKVVNNVAEVQWHSTQEVTLNQDGSATIEFRVDGLEEIAWWILGYGDQVQVLAPKALRKKIIEKARNMIKINEQLEQKIKTSEIPIVELPYKTTAASAATSNS